MPQSGTEVQERHVGRRVSKPEQTEVLRLCERALGQTDMEFINKGLWKYLEKGGVSEGSWSL